jgi:hypothetical protein
MVAGHQVTFAGSVQPQSRGTLDEQHPFVTGLVVGASAGVVWPCDTIRSIRTPGRSRSVANASSGPRCARSANRFVTLIMREALRFGPRTDQP